MSFDVVALSLSGGLLLGYHVIFVCVGGRRALLGLMLQAGPAWAAKHLGATSAQDVVLAIQTLRNSVIVAVFVGTLAFNQASVALDSVARGTTGGGSVDLQMTRSIILAVLYYASFINFALTIRWAAHTGYLLGGAQFLEAAGSLAPQWQPAQEDARPAAPDLEAEGPSLRHPWRRMLSMAVPTHKYTVPELRAHLTQMVRLQSMHNSAGFRALYCSVPFAFYAAGSVALLVATGLMLAFLVYHDFAHLWLRSGSSPLDVPLAAAREAGAEP
jgi:hypothetical protein